MLCISPRLPRLPRALCGLILLADALFQHRDHGVFTEIHRVSYDVKSLMNANFEEIYE